VWSQAASHVAALLTDEDPDVRFESARSLGSIDPGITAARNVLVTMLNDEETQPLMLSIVVAALGERHDLQSADVIERLKVLLSHPQAEVRESVSAVVSPGSIAEQLIDPLVAALDDDEPIVRENAATALGNSGDDGSRIQEALSIAERDEDEGVAEAARAALSKLRQG
jgi:HEAT repeat protein